MNYNFFADCKDLAEAKRRYIELVKKHHPDAGGDTKTMQDINAEWALFQARGATNEARQRQTDAHAAGKKSAADYHDLESLEKDLQTMINFALNLDGVEIELMGLWVWLTGNTRAHKEKLKEWNQTSALKWIWSPKKTAWYYAGVPSFNRQKTTLDEIRNHYGSQKFTRDDERQQARAIPQGI